MEAVKWGRFWQSLQALGLRPSSPQLSRLIQMKSQRRVTTIDHAAYLISEGRESVADLSACCASNA